MTAIPIETKLLELIATCRGLLPTEELDEMSELARAGEPGIALENLFTQLHEYDAHVDEATVKDLEALGKTMGLDAKYWVRLERM
jgi:hypothetical protein